jgi:uncharacterized phage protein (TIGR01671 family)
MSREIKFRAWDGEKYLHHSGGKFDREWIYLKVEGGIWSKWGSFASYTKNLVLQQYTGLKDKNGIEIYEGDLVNFILPKLTHGRDQENYFKEEVWFDDGDGSWAFGRFVQTGPPPIEWSYYFNEIADVEVIGNIFETNKMKNANYHNGIYFCKGCSGRVISRLCSCGTPHPEFNTIIK